MSTMRLIGYNVLTAAVLLVPIELGLRFFQVGVIPAPPPFHFGEPMTARYPLDPDLLWAPPGYPYRIATARGQYPSIVFMGDSCTYAGRYDEKLESIFEARNPESDFTFVNVGVPGWSSWSGLQQLQRDVLPMRPKAITIYYGWNDHWEHFGLQDRHATRSIEEPSALLTADLAGEAFFAFRRLFTEYSPYRVPLADFRRNLRRMVRIARDNGIIPILLTAPTSHQAGREPSYLAERRLTNLADLVPLHRRYVQVVREVAAEEDALLVDLHQAFDRLPRRDLEQLFTEDGIHLTWAGDQKIAELIDQHLVEADLYRRIAGSRPAEHAEAEERFERFKEALGYARPLAGGRADVRFDAGRLIYVKDRCAASEDEERFFLHVWPVDPDDLPEHRRESGFDNLDFDLSQMRLGFTQGCAAARPLPDYPITAVRTGQFAVAEGGISSLWEEEIRFGPAGRAPLGEYLADRVRGRRPAIDADFDVHLVDDTLVYVKDACGPEDVDARFFLHVEAVDPDDLPVSRRPHGFDNLDFRFDGRGARFDGACLAGAPLPAYGVAAVRTGQFAEAEGGFRRLWEGEIRLGVDR